MSRLLFTLALVVISSLSSTACLRYSSRHGDDDGPGSPKFEGENAFYRNETNQRRRLEQLLKARAALPSDNVYDTYGVGACDLLRIQVFESPELAGVIRVRPDGNIALPLVGEIPVAGKTEAEIGSVLTAKLSSYVKDPQISVSIEEYCAHKIAVLGEVQKPGPYPLKRQNHSILEVISEAGGKTNRGGHSVVLIPSSKNLPDPANLGKDPRDVLKKLTLGVEIDFDELLGKGGKPPLNVPLVSGDLLVIPAIGNVQVDGEVEKPGNVPMTSRMSALGIIAAAGGFTYSADNENVEIIRELDNGRKALITVNLSSVLSGSDVRVRDGDVIIVPSSPGLFVLRQAADNIRSILGFSASKTVQ